jgi:hypothetical protein
MTAIMSVEEPSWFHPVAFRTQSRCKAIPSPFALGSHR